MNAQDRDLILYRIGRASETLKEAESMIENKFWNASINRTYYACYYAVGALLLTKDLDTSTHKGMRQLFGLHFVQPGIISKDYGKFFTDLFDKRQTGDYDDFVSYDKETATYLYTTAKEFIKEIKILVEQRSSK
jgi:uncharacterized protein (UPF0332 family)